ncbi:peptide/nickel transport system permease protein [Pseudonocardia hierapolitana]|uniref:Oligopeptide transport system permease protein OppC n=1 Tax=Pseudonocardia hierapolitana TaxID=1128676 RepID=A0A561SMX6_9PSEU|nr:ABC transporter permease [Pseudonocardia hierapolitana]TWF76215.1 peptide/nickel transport system permease protein [Pseudonocardia hierapolitana]
MSAPVESSAPVGPAEPVVAGRTTRGRLVARRFLRNWQGLLGLTSIVLLFALAYIGPLVNDWGYDQLDYTSFLEAPSADHWFGTTQVGADVFAQTMRGLQKSLVIGLLVGLISTGLAAVVGAAAGYFGGWVDRVLMWVVDLLLVLPSFLIIAILSPTFRGETWLVFVVLLAAFGWMITARIVRGMTLSLREREFVKAARFTGVPPWKIIFRHIVPNMSSLLIIDATITVGSAILAETGLSFFGFGVQPPDVSLGSLIAAGTDSALTYPWLFLFSAGFLVVAVLSVNLVGDGLRDALDASSQRAAKGDR